jgi:hypothetical protein
MQLDSRLGCRQIGKNVAEASSESGLLGIGDVKVSKAEKATLADISNALERESESGYAGSPAISLGSPNA